MSEVPKLTDAEAAVLRECALPIDDRDGIYISLHARGLASLDKATVIGKRALAAYNAAKRAEIEAPLRERIARLKAMLREREWDEPSHIMDGDLRVPVNRCSRCGRHEQEGHDTACAVGIELEAAMKEAAR